MRWLPLSVILCLGLLTLPAPAARACINDREVETHEREFKSQYLKQPYGSPEGAEPSGPAAGSEWKEVAAAGLGVGLLAGAVVVGLVRPPSRR